ncbi:MAG: hypothetical protein HWD61_09705 [Parachlamydiaceae bacterium]|nr:MAG: hypothetical protein HWD61_09705 [Parachlamydiaceae bacterium]
MAESNDSPQKNVHVWRNLDSVTVLKTKLVPVCNNSTIVNVILTQKKMHSYKIILKHLVHVCKNLEVVNVQRGCLSMYRTARSMSVCVT